MKKLFKIITTASIFFLLCPLPSCKKFLETPPPKTELVATSVFTSDNSATSAIVGIYSNMMQTFGFISLDASIFPGFSSDELGYPSGAQPTWVQILNNSITSDNSDVNTCWANAYTYISQANSAIAGIQASTGITPATKNQLMGEAEFIRAFNYFYLVNLFGDVPLVLNTNYVTTTTLSRTPTATVYNQIIADLKDAQSKLSVDYVTDQRVRPNMWTATALLARVYLYTGDWKDAEAQATSIINSGTYTLSPLSTAFLYTSNETIWQLMPVNPSYNTLVAFRIVAVSLTSKPNVIMTDDLVNSFEPGDARSTTWMRASVAAGVTYYSTYKYHIQRGGSPLNEYFIVFRLSEIYLIRAEAEDHQGEYASSIADINVIRNKASLPSLLATMQSDSIPLAIENERRHELFGEWGHRWFDLKRNNRLDAVIGAYKGTLWKSTDALWPIPVSEIEADPHLVQNPGY